ncbi:MAG: BamA/TamA family outer membrane protein [Bacteroidia bacterium]
MVFYLTCFAAKAQQADSAEAAQKDLIDLFLSTTKWETKADKRVTNKVNFSIVPGGGEVGESKLIVTAVNAAFYLGDSSTTNLSNLYFLPYTDFAGRYGIIIRPNFWTVNNILNLNGEVRFGSYRISDYGLGATSSEENANELNYDHTRLYITANRLIIKHLYLGIGYNQDYFYNVNENWVYDGESDFTGYGTGTDSTTISSGITFNLLRDSRKNSINPKGGFYSNAIYKINTHSMGSSFEWTSLYLDSRKYFSLNDSRHSILGFWAFYWGTYGDVPYLNLPGTTLDLAGRSGRGYFYGRYRGKQMLYAESEYRFDLSANGFWGGVVFASAQSVTEPSSQKFEHIRPAVGAGLRLKFNKKSASNVTLDFGVGKDSFNVHLNLGEFF